MTMRRAGAKGQKNHKDGGNQGDIESSTQRVTFRRHDADQPGEQCAAESRSTKEQSAEPVRVFPKNRGEPGYEDRVLRRKAKARHGCSHVQCGWRAGDSDDGGARGSQDQTPYRNNHLGNPPQRQWRNPTSQEQKSIKVRGRGCKNTAIHAGQPFFKSGHPPADSDFHPNVDEEKKQQGDGRRIAKVLDPICEGMRRSDRQRLGWPEEMQDAEYEGEQSECNREAAYANIGQEKADEKRAKDRTNTPGKVEKRNGSRGIRRRNLRAAQIDCWIRQAVAKAVDADHDRRETPRPDSQKREADNEREKAHSRHFGKAQTGKQQAGQANAKETAEVLRGEKKSSLRI